MARENETTNFGGKIPADLADWYASHFPFWGANTQFCILFLQELRKTIENQPSFYEHVAETLKRMAIDAQNRRME
jgi:hypothetical protein